MEILFEIKKFHLLDVGLFLFEKTSPDQDQLRSPFWT